MTPDTEPEGLTKQRIVTRSSKGSRMNDLISRQAAIDAIMGEPTDAHYPSWYAERLEQLPSAQPEQQWIPCSERLPEAEDCPMDCLVTRKSKYIGNYTDMAVCEKNGMWTHEDWDAIVLGDVKDGKSTGLISTRDDDIIAWMPLPEPYKAGEQG